MSRDWRTWSGTVRCTPAELVAPATEAALVRAVRTAADRGLTVRAAGSGHSFNQLVCTDGLLLDLTGYTGIVALDPAAGTVTVRAGTRLGELGRVLDRAGLALANIGTLADQTVAGAVSTGNHGTGLLHPPLSGQLAGLRLVTADGTVREVGPQDDPELFRCARTGLGALGVISTVTFRCVPQFRLEVARHTEPLAGLLDRLPEWGAGADHVGFGWQPWQDLASVRTLRRTDARRTRGAGRHRYAATLEELRCGLIGQAARLYRGAVPALCAAPADAVEAADAGRSGAVRYVDASHRAFTFPQPVRFIAMEHALPLANVAVALRRLRGPLRRLGLHSPYPVLVRVGAGDDSPLSPAYGRPTGYVNLTVPRTARYLEVLRTAEPILRELDGRPHWGKAHTATAPVLAPRYPEWDTFARMRARMDPAGMFDNDYLARVLGAADRTADPLALAGAWR